MHNDVVSYRSDVGRLVIGCVVRIMEDRNHNMIGHVKGFGMNCYDEITVLVALCNKEEYYIHNTYLEVLK